MLKVAAWRCQIWQPLHFSKTNALASMERAARFASDMLPMNRRDSAAQIGNCRNKSLLASAARLVYARQRQQSGVVWCCCGVAAVWCCCQNANVQMSTGASTLFSLFLSPGHACGGSLPDQVLMTTASFGPPSCLGLPEHPHAMLKAALTRQS